MRTFFHSLIVFLCLLPAIAGAESSATDAASVRAFFESIYRHYGKNGKGIDPLGTAGAKVFDSSFRALLRADARAAGPGEVGVVDSDLLCACQDWDNVRDLSVALRPGGPSITIADVSFALGTGTNARRKIEFALVRVHGDWRIHNVIDRTDPAQPFDLRAAILRELDELKHRPAAKLRP
jgi:hypothetical protein